MAGERRFIAAHLAPIADNSAARGLADDAAVWTPPLGRDLVFTHDVLAEGVHYLPDDPARDVAWKLVAVNLSDLAAMGAKPAGLLLGLGLSRDCPEQWRSEFAAGLGHVAGLWRVGLWGGDTVSGLDRTVLGLTAIGTVAPGRALSRAGAAPGDLIWVSGSIGDAGLGLAIAKGEAPGDKALLNRFRRPVPRLALGAALAGRASACLDVSDGLLIDAERLAAASGVRLAIDLAAMPVSAAARARAGDDDAARLRLATAGDDYELLFTAPPGLDVAALAAAARTPITCIGRVAPGAGLALTGQHGPLALPDRLGWEH